MSKLCLHLLFLSFGLIRGLNAMDDTMADSVFPDPDTVSETVCLAQLPRALERTWSSSDLATTLTEGRGGLTFLFDFWDKNRQEPGPHARKRLAQIADICLPLSQRNKIPDPKTHSANTNLWWLYATKDWMAASNLNALSPAQVDALVLGQLDGTGPHRLHPECEELVGLAARTSGQGVEKLHDFLTSANGWIADQRFNSLVVALWTAHPDWRPATGKAWGDLYLKDAGTRLLVNIALDTIYSQGTDPIINDFIKDGLDRFPGGVADDLGYALHGATFDKPFTVSADQAIAWAEKQADLDGWEPYHTLMFLGAWIMGDAHMRHAFEPADHLAIGRHAEKIRSLYQRALRDVRPGLKRDNPEFPRRLNAYEGEWVKTQKQ